MAHTGHIDGLALDDSEDQDQEPSNRPRDKDDEGSDQHDEATIETHQGTTTNGERTHGSTR
eukprot:12933314-Prorocentrum_lima.AAC.1